MGRAAKMAIPEYQGEMQPGAQKQDMAKGGPKQTPRKDYCKPSSSVQASHHVVVSAMRL